MFGSISGTEIIVILALALLLFGPRRLPQIGRTIGRALSEFRKATQDFKTSLEREVDVDELRKTRSSLEGAGNEVRQTIREFETTARGSISDNAKERRPDTPRPAPAPSDGETSEQS
jgi:TatA/E family protein of Tat protein translocase